MNTEQTTELFNEVDEVLSNEETTISEGSEPAKEDVSVESTNTNNEQIEVEKKVQTKEENSEFARKRREAEKQAEIDKVREETRIQTIIENVGVNPYTQEPLEDADDVKIFEAMKKYEKDGGDPVADQRKIIKEVLGKERKTLETQKKEEDAASVSREKAKSEIQEIRQAYPNLDVQKLINNPDFVEYSEGKVGKKSLKTLYEGFCRLTGKPLTSSQEIREKAKEEASTGSLKGEKDGGNALLTKEEIAEKAKDKKWLDNNWDLVQKSLGLK